MLDPEPGMKCIDPACGTGGFIVVILNYMAEKILSSMCEALSEFCVGFNQGLRRGRFVEL